MAFQVEAGAGDQRQVLPGLLQLGLDDGAEAQQRVLIRGAGFPLRGAEAQRARVGRRGGGPQQARRHPAWLQSSTGWLCRSFCQSSLDEQEEGLLRVGRGEFQAIGPGMGRHDPALGHMPVLGRPARQRQVELMAALGRGLQAQPQHARLPGKLGDLDDLVVALGHLVAAGRAVAGAGDGLGQAAPPNQTRCPRPRRRPSWRPGPARRPGARGQLKGPEYGVDEMRSAHGANSTSELSQRGPRIPRRDTGTPRKPGPWVIIKGYGIPSCSQWMRGGHASESTLVLPPCPLQPMKPLPSLLACAALAAASLLWPAQQAAAARPRALVYCADASPEGFDPGMWDSASTNTVSKQMFQGLLDFRRGTTELVPKLATAGSCSPDAKTITFTLRSGVRFHTTPYFKPTREFNADDVTSPSSASSIRRRPFNQAFPATFVFPQNIGLAHAAGRHRPRGRAHGPLPAEAGQRALHHQLRDGLDEHPVGRVRRRNCWPRAGPARSATSRSARDPIASSPMPRTT